MDHAGLRWTVPIPRFQFANRQAEITQINDFLTHPGARGRLLLVVAPSGHGKSRLLDHVTLNPPEGVIPLILNSKQREATQAGLAAGFTVEAEQLLARRGLRNISDAVSDASRSSSHFIAGVVPKLIRGTPIVGAAAEFTAESFVEALSRASSAHVAQIRRVFERLRGRLGPTRVIVIVDDVHALPLAEQYVLSDLITVGREVEGMDVRFIFGSRPLTDDGPGSIRELCERVASDGKLAQIDLRALAHETMREIAVSVSSTPAALEPAIEVAAGNPQRFLQSLIDLNLNGELVLDDGMLQVPLNAVALENSVSTLLEKLEPVARRIIAVLAVAHHDITLNGLQNSYANVGARDPGEIVSALQKLDETRLIASRTMSIRGRREVGVYVAHDSVRDVVRYELRTKRFLEYLFINEVAADIASYQIASLRSSPNVALDGDSARHSLIIGRAICLREAQKSGWEESAIEALASAEASSRLGDIVDLGRSLLDAFRDIFEPDAEPRRSIARQLVRANYQLGRYLDCIALVEDEKLEDGESLYLRAISYTIVKPDIDTIAVVSAARVTARPRSDAQEWEPLLVLTEAVALQEGGSFSEADRIYQAYLAAASSNRDTPQFWQFAYAAPLFLKARESYDLAREAFEWFDARANDRSSGMAANNQGYAAMRMRDYDLALRCFDLSAARLNRGNPHEAVFPLSNIGFVRILRGEAEAARSVLTSCLFRRLWPEYEASVLINMAYATWLAGWDDPQRFLRRIRRSPGMEHDTWGLAVQEYARCVLDLLPRSGTPTAERFQECETAMRRLAAFGAIAPYWNALVREVGTRFGLAGTQVSIESHRPATATTTDPSISIARPAGHCFAHV